MKKGKGNATVRKHAATKGKRQQKDVNDFSEWAATKRAKAGRSSELTAQPSCKAEDVEVTCDGQNLTMAHRDEDDDEDDDIPIAEMCRGAEHGVQGHPQLCGKKAPSDGQKTKAAPSADGTWTGSKSDTDIVEERTQDATSERMRMEMEQRRLELETEMKRRQFEADEKRLEREHALKAQRLTGEQEERRRHQDQMEQFAGMLMEFGKTLSAKSASLNGPPSTSS